MRILVVEDDAAIAQAIEALLVSQHYTVDTAASGLEGLERAEACSYDLMLIDIELPGIDGASICQQLRTRGVQTPILLLTSPTTETHIKVTASKTGANDYVSKPFNVEELLARIQSLLHYNALSSSSVLRWGALAAVPDRLEVSYGEMRLHLTPKEYCLLEVLLRQAPNIVSARTIGEQGWNGLDARSDKSVRLHLQKLRNKLKVAGAPEDFIKTVHRQGYQLNPRYGEATFSGQEEATATLQVAELKAVNEELRKNLEQLQATQAELQRKNQELQVARDELEQHVADRTAELDHWEAFLSSIYDGIEQSIFVVDVTASNDFRYVSFNRSAQQSTGLSLQDIQNKTPEEVFGLETGLLFRQNYGRCLQANQSITYEDHFIFRDRPVWTLTTLTPLPSPQGRIGWIVGTVLDISDRKQTEAELRESEQQYRSLFESIDQGFCLLEVLFDANAKAVDYRFVEINEAFEQQSGLVNAVGKTILELVPNLEPQWAELYGQVAKSGEAVRFEADVSSMDRVFDIYAFSSGAPGQNLIAVLFTDITERKRTEEILRRTAELDAFRVSLADALSPLTDASEIQAITARILGESLRATRVVYIEVVSEGEEVIIHRNYTNGVAELSGQYRLEDYRRNLIADHQAGHTQVVTDIPSNPEYTNVEKARYRELEIAAHVDVPLIKNNQFVALLAVHQSTPRQWSETEVKLVEEAAERTWAAVERARVEAALHQNEEMLRLALAGSHAGTWDWVLATGQLTWSPETYRLYGLDLTTPLPEYEDWYENILHPDDRTLVSNYMNQVIVQRQFDFQLEFRILHPQQGVRWILSLGHLAVNEQGEPVRLSGINLDISDRKQAELALQQQIRQEYLLADIAQEIRQSLDLDQVLHSTVERVREGLNCDRVVIFRFRPDWQGDVTMESVGDAWLAIQSTTIVDPCIEARFIEPYRQGHVSILNDVNQSGLAPCYVEFLQQIQVKASLAVPILQGNELWGLLIAHQCSAPRQWHVGEIALLRRLAIQVGIATQQAELYQQVQQQAMLLDVATDAIFVRDMHHHILYWNQGAANIFGWSADEAVGQPADDLLSCDRDQVASILQTLLSQDGWQGEIQEWTKTGDRVTVFARWTLLRNKDGQPQSILSVETDMTERKNLETQFYQAQRLESLGILAAGIAHDLNNVLTPILTVAQLLQLTQKGLDALGLEQLKLLETSAKRGAKLVKQISTVTRATQGERTPVDLLTLLQEEVEIIQQSFPKAIAIQADLPPSHGAQSDLGMILVDPTYLHQIILNLCVNARDAMPNGGILTISAAAVVVDDVMAAQNLDARVGHYAVITIADTGTGIAPDVQERMFDPFFTTKEPGRGTGLGLATVYGLVKANQGFVQVFSEVGQGTQFKVFFPLIASGTPAQESALPISDVTAENYGALVLVVEDEAIVRSALQSLLESRRYRTLLAQDGADALERYGQHQSEIQLVVTDLMMPTMDGFTLIGHLKAMNPNVHIIALSGVPAHEETALAVGADYFLAKPFDAETLLSHISNC